MSVHGRAVGRTPQPGADAHRDEGGPTAAAPEAPIPLEGLGGAVGALVVGRADDVAERRADELADNALARLRRSVPTDGSEHGQGTPITLPGAVVGPAGGAIDARTSARIGALRGHGTGLAGVQRTRMESAFGAPLGRVRVHRGAEAARLNRSMSAEAFTIGDDIFLGGSAASGPVAERVLAHEIAHVLSEPRGGGAVRRANVFSKVFGKKELTDDEKREQAQEKAERQRIKDESKANKVAAKQSKRTERTEKRALAQSRKQGKAGRAALQASMYDPGPNGEDVSGQRAGALNAQFAEALEYELGLYRTLMLGRSRRSGQQPLTEAEAADQAYHETWHVRFPELTSVRPPRETAAERLVIQVRRIRTEGSIQQQQLADETRADKATIKLRMLGRNVEIAYERMATLRAELQEKQPQLHPALAQDQAAQVIRGSLDPKVADAMPPKDGALDVAAWAQATERVEAKQRQAQRDRDSIETSLALLPPDQRSTSQNKRKDDDPLAAADTVLTGMQTYGAPVLEGVSGLGGAIAGQVGRPQDKQLAKDAGLTKTSYGPVVPAKLDQGISQLVHDSRQADDLRSKGQLKPPTMPQSDATKAKLGMGQVVGIFTSLLGAAQSALSMVKSTQAAWNNNDAYEGLKATKAGAAGLSGLVGAAKNSANLAKTIDGSVGSVVSKVVPGLDIASAVLSIVKATMDVAGTGMRQRETDLSMFAARARSTDRVDVTVYPLMKVSQVYTKQLENGCWTLGSAIGDLVLAIAQVASGGGYGIPLAVKSGKAVLDNLHALGHYIADNVLAVMAKRTQKESELLHLEGAAEDELKRHPKMAVDGIVVQAAQGDPVAIEFLSHYRIGGKRITAAYVQQINPASIRPGADPEQGGGQHSMLLAQIRSAVLGSMSTSADPKTTYDEIMGHLDTARGVVKTVGSTASSLSTSWKQTGSLAQQRNQLARDARLGDNSKTDRGLVWRIRMYLSTEKRGKLTQRTQAYQDTEPLPRGVICVIGDNEIGQSAGDQALNQLVATVTVADLEAELARRPRRNPPEAIELIRDLLKGKTTGNVPVSADAP